MAPLDAPASDAVDVGMATRAEVARHTHWRRAFAAQRKDHRFYELLEDTVRQGFEYRYFVMRDAMGRVRTIQPFFLLDQDVLAGIGHATKAAAALRRIWPRFMKLRTLMVGCAAGEGHIDEAGIPLNAMPLLAERIPALARALGAKLIVLKEFPAQYRSRLHCFEQAGFKRIPSMPMTRLDLDFPSFEHFLSEKLGPSTRRSLRRKFRTADGSSPIELTAARDITPHISELYPLYLQVFERSNLHFEKVTPDFFCHIGKAMPDKARFFIWRQNKRPVAFALCLVYGDELFAEYLGLDYEVALDLHLYYRATRDVIDWAIANGYKTFRSSGLNYEPKLRMRHTLEPLDLYIKHTDPALNYLLKRLLPLLEPTRYDATLRKFFNYNDLWSR